MAHRRPLCAGALAAGLLLAPAPASAADPGVLSGRIADGKLPPAAAGRVTVRAARAPDGRLLEAVTAGRRGTWSFGETEPGSYVVFADVTRTGKRPVSALTPVQRVRSGRTTRTTISLKRRRTPRARRGHAGARAAASTTTPVAVRNFTASGPNSQLGNGLADMLITSLVNTRSGDCTPTVVEWEHRADLEREIDLANSRIADPRSRIPRGNMLDPAVFVQGQVTTTATSASWTIELVDAATGDVLGTETGSANGLAIFDAPADLAQRIADRLCGGDYRVALTINAVIAVPPYIGSAIMTADVPVRDVSGATPPTSWLGQEVVSFGALQYAGIPECVVLPGGHSGYAKVEITRIPGDMIEVHWGGETNALTTLACPDAPPIPFGVPPVQPFQGTAPTVFVLPLSGGTQNVSGGLGTAGGGWTNSGTVTVTRVPRGSP